VGAGAQTGAVRLVSGRGRWVDPFAGMAGRRLFVAVPLDRAAVAEVTALVQEVRALALPAGLRDVRWVRMDGLHLTLRFLGPAPEPRVAPTAAAVTAVAAETVRIDGRLAGVGTFPERGRPRAIWIGVGHGADELATLSDRLTAGLRAAGWVLDDRPFRPHLTLARSDGLAAGAVVADRLAAVLGARTLPFQVDRVTLFESITGDGPARYVPVAEVGLRPPD